MAITQDMFFLNTRFEGTLQNQIQQMVAEGILSGRFRPGEKMPSTRKLARHLGVSRITVTLAYTELQANDYLHAEGRSGFYVSNTAPQPRRLTPAEHGASTVDWGEALACPNAEDAGLRKPADWRSYKYPFIYGQADPTLFDYKTWRLCALQALGQREFDSLTGDYADRDDEKLVEFVTRHILPRRGIVVGADEVLVTLGAQNGLWIAAQLLLSASRKAVIEQPCYPSLRDILSRTECQTEAVTVDRDGLPPNAVPSDTDVVFVTPSHQCPTNATMPMERRRSLLEAAERDKFLVVEDDYEFELSFLKSPYPSLKSIDRGGRVIYVGSFSKSLFPGLRLGYLVGPAPFIEAARALRTAMLRHPPGQMQRTAALFLQLGHYDALLKRIGRAFQSRWNTMAQEIHAHGLTIAGAGVFGGSSFWMRAPDGMDAEDLAERLRERRVLIEPGQAFFYENGPREFYRLGFSSIPETRIPDGIALIAAASRGEAG